MRGGGYGFQEILKYILKEENIEKQCPNNAERVVQLCRCRIFK